MQKLILAAVALVAAFGFFVPGEPEAPASAEAAAAPGLFEAAPYQVTQLKRKADGHFYVTAKVNGAATHFVVDTGATTVALTEEAARAAGFEFSASEFEPIGRTANGVARGKAITLRKVSIEGKDATEVDGVIIEGAEVSLLGQSYLSRISGVEMSGEYMILR